MTTATINASDSAAIRRDEDVVTSFYKIGSTTSPYDQWYYRGLLYFSLSSIPAGAIVTSAEIHVYLKDNLGTNSGSYSAHRVEQSWVGSQVTRCWRTSSDSWSAIGGAFQASTSFYTPVLSASEGSGWKVFGATSLAVENIQGMLLGTVSNYGWLLKNSENANRAHGFDRVGNVPRLVVVYQVDAPRAVTMFF